MSNCEVLLVGGTKEVYRNVSAKLSDQNNLVITKDNNVVAVYYLRNIVGANIISVDDMIDKSLSAVDESLDADAHTLDCLKYYANLTSRDTTKVSDKDLVNHILSFKCELHPEMEEKQ